MNKKMIALAVLGAVAAPAAMAQSANPVTLYGRIYATVSSVSATGGTTTALPTRLVVKDESSLIGFRGTEDLGGGLKAWFQLESSAPPDAGGTAVSGGVTSGTFGSRNSAVGLQGEWGSVFLGRWDSPFKQAELLVDPTGELTIADPEAIIGDKNNFTRRANNTVAYWSPNINGFQARVHYVANEGKVPAVGTALPVNPYDISMNMIYNPTGTPFTVGYSWEKHHDQQGGTTVSGIDEKGQLLLAQGKFGPFTLNLMGQRFNKTTKADLKVTYVNGMYDFGQNSIWLTYGRSNGGQLLTATTEAPQGRMSALGYYYNFSKRTTFVAVYSNITNNSTANYTFNGNNGTLIAGANLGTPASPNVANGQNPHGFGIGLRHVF